MAYYIYLYSSMHAVHVSRRPPRGRAWAPRGDDVLGKMLYLRLYYVLDLVRYLLSFGRLML